MSVAQTWVERHGEQDTLVGFIVDGPTTVLGVQTELLAAIPTTYDWRILNRIEDITLFEGYTDKWLTRVKYAAFREKRKLQSGEMEFQFETTGAQAKRTVSRSARVFDADGLISPAPSDAQIIGWNPAAGTASGVTVDETAYSFGWTVMVPFSTASESWRRSAGELRGTTNSGSFFGYAAGEVKFEKIRGSVRGAEDYRIEMQFSRRENIASLTVGGVTITTLKGWEYLDVDQQTFEIDSKGRRVPKVSRVKVHELFPSASWAILSTLLGV